MEFGKTIIDDAVSLLPKAYKLIENRVYRCKKKKAAPSISYYLTFGTSPGEYYNQFVNIIMGISNFEIERIFNAADIRDLSENFVGVFPSDRMNRFFDLKKKR